ncbi:MULTISPECIES: hypothetical protein [unclassified Kitasatospora]|uniref:hypothetical protein n=1 Tax=unclassified Kitasatospora TaxID=2633591 RepID=UPI00070B7038|nr:MULTISPECIES: hypothetical protein [unclassified Kitasatospora]KQV11419.1 hypothetical protein ASC99_35955 [Kitasatospora sp. Root107]KRB66957.1 hypothetical protein ASE03_30475 [Kitasatospora sp. Root187]
MTDLKVFRRTDDGRDVEVRGATVALEVELQRRVEAGMEAMLGIRFVASEYPTGVTGTGDCAPMRNLRRGPARQVNDRTFVAEPCSPRLVTTPAAEGDAS